MLGWVRGRWRGRGREEVFDRVLLGPAGKAAIILVIRGLVSVVLRRWGSAKVWFYQLS